MADGGVTTTWQMVWRSRRWWFLLAVTLCVSGITFRLGLWQLGRASQKEAIYEQQQAQMHLPAMTNADVLSEPDAAANLYRKVELQGRWASDYTVYLANRARQSQSGFLVLTPLCLQEKQCVLVVRGWAPRDWVDSAKLPPVSTPSGTVEVEGLRVLAPSHMMELGAGATETMKPKAFEPLRQNIDVDAYAREIGLHIVASVQQLGEPAEGVIRQPPNILHGADKNKAYAAQWFALSALCLGLFIWFQIVQKYRHG